MQLMYEHLSTLADLNKRQDNFFTEAEEFKNEMNRFKVTIIPFLLLLTVSYNLPNLTPYNALKIQRRRTRQYIYHVYI